MCVAQEKKYGLSCAALGRDFQAHHVEMLHSNKCENVTYDELERLLLSVGFDGEIIRDTACFTAGRPHRIFTAFVCWQGELRAPFDCSARAKAHRLLQASSGSSPSVPLRPLL